MAESTGQIPEQLGPKGVISLRLGLKPGLARRGWPFEAFGALWVVDMERLGHSETMANSCSKGQRATTTLKVRFRCKMFGVPRKDEEILPDPLGTDSKSLAQIQESIDDCLVGSLDYGALMTFDEPEMPHVEEWM